MDLIAMLCFSVEPGKEYDVAHTVLSLAAADFFFFVGKAKTRDGYQLWQFGTHQIPLRWNLFPWTATHLVPPNPKPKPKILMFPRWRSFMSAIPAGQEPPHQSAVGGEKKKKLFFSVHFSHWGEASHMALSVFRTVLSSPPRRGGRTLVRSRVSVTACYDSPIELSKLWDQMGVSFAGLSFMRFGDASC